MKLNIENALRFVNQNEYTEMCKKAQEKLTVLNTGTGEGNDFLGWIDLPNSYSDEDIEDIQNVADRMRKLDCVIIIGIGGSYLGAKATIEALKPHFEKMDTEIIFAGHTLSGNYHAELIDYLSDKQFGIVVISKSGTTTEPAVAFRLLYAEMQKRFDKETIRDRIVVITDEKKGALRTLCDKEGFDDFIIADNVGGRFSVLSPVGLLPIAIAGFDIEEMLHGASMAQDICLEDNVKNPAIQYAAIRNMLYNDGKKVELMVNYNPRLKYFAEWWKQLYGESEGKNHKGLFTASVSYTTDLHSLGQFVQDGSPILFENVLWVNDDSDAPVVPHDDENLDKLNYLEGKNMEYINSKAAEGTMNAHVAGDVPNIRIEIDAVDEYNLGFLMYFFEIACGISAYILNVNPFNQPGVEAYKKEMFRLLGKE
ncbi:MAG: glucose-6-phosphate isomerase [Bacteroidales bacterium]|nr:glucose-6-phosphate isomerase [Bacteroidales bacterium]